MAGDDAHQIGACLIRSCAEGGSALRRLNEIVERFRVTGEAGERPWIGEQCRHYLWVSSDRLKARGSRQRAEAWIVDEQLERVGLHQLRDSCIAERNISIAELARNIALSRCDRARARPERRINAPKAVGA